MAGKKDDWIILRPYRYIIGLFPYEWNGQGTLLWAGRQIMTKVQQALFIFR